MSSINEVNVITIVGGGTAGWLTAAYLTEKYKDISIKLIDKESSTPVGVGEGTLLSFNNIMIECGFTPSDWFFEIDATFKSGILFPKWGKDETSVWHPFMFLKTTLDYQDVSIIDLWTQRQDLDFKNYGLSLYDISIHNKIDHSNIEFYAFHIDALKLVNFLKEEVLKRSNFKFIESTVQFVNKNNNTVENLFLENNETITSDLFIDCTGFLKLLSSEDSVVDLQDRLFCNTAIAAHVPYKNKEIEMHPYVISEKVAHGWIWNIPIQTRIGSGIVFNRSITSIEEAKKFFIEYWDHRINEENLKVLDWSPRYSKTPWNQNVVSIGLSAGFIEPLESTGIALIISGIEKLEIILQDNYYTADDVEYYNLLMTQEFEDAVDFVNMHYENQPADSEFWKWVSKKHFKSDKHKFYLNQLKKHKVQPSSPTRNFFSSNNWVCWLVQKGSEINSNVSTNSELVELFYNEEQKRKINTPSHVEYLDFLKEQK